MKNNSRKIETLKEFFNLPDNKPAFIGTPAHPFPKFLPKKIALIIIVLLIAVFLINGANELFNLLGWKIK